jgi:hypothetical protein
MDFTSQQNQAEAFANRSVCEESQNRISGCFSGIGCLERPYHIELNSAVQPVIVPPRRIPFCLEDRVKYALDEMCNQGINV